MDSQWETARIVQYIEYLRRESKETTTKQLH